MLSRYQEPVCQSRSRITASMEQPAGPIHDLDTMVGYILGDRAAEAGEIMYKDVEREMTLSGFPSVTVKTFQRWGCLISDLPEQRVTDGFLPHRNTPTLFKDCPFDLLMVIANASRMGNCRRLILNGSIVSWEGIRATYIHNQVIRHRKP